VGFLQLQESVNCGSGTQVDTHFFWLCCRGSNLQYSSVAERVVVEVVLIQIPAGLCFSVLQFLRQLHSLVSSFHGSEVSTQELVYSLRCNLANFTHKLLCIFWHRLNCISVTIIPGDSHLPGKKRPYKGKSGRKLKRSD